MPEHHGVKRLTVLSDTHGLLRPEIVGAARGTDLILHAGDVGADTVLPALRAIAPTVAVRGNVDRPSPDLPATATVAVNGSLFYVLHRLEDLDLTPAVAGVRCVVYGHSHRAETTAQAGVVYLNPGSVGPRRFRLPVTWAELLWSGRGWIGEFWELADPANGKEVRRRGKSFEVRP